MRMFYIQSRKGVVSILEVEIEKVSAIEDPSVMWLGDGEYRAKVLKPTSLYEDKKGVMVPAVWCWHAFHSTVEEAKTRAEQDIKHEMERDARKGKTTFDLEEFAKRCEQIQVLYL